MEVSLAFQLSPTICNIIDSNDKFPVRRILCVGANYVAHAIEMGRDPSREPPFFFAKPTDAIVNADRVLDAIIPYPPNTSNFHYEMEMVVAIGKNAQNIEVEEAPNVIWGYGAGIDLTRRDLQKAAKDKGRPWELGKGFDNSAIISSLCPVSKIGHPKDSRIWLTVNDTITTELCRGCVVKISTKVGEVSKNPKCYRCNGLLKAR